MKKSMLFIFLFCMSFLLFSCDGLNATRELKLKSIVDDHQTTIYLKTKVDGFNYGDILSPDQGKSKFSTKVSYSLEDLEKELKLNNHHINIQKIGNDIISILESTENQRNYCYFIKSLGTIDNKNQYIIGEQRFRIDLGENEYSLVMLPYHYLEDVVFDGYISRYAAIKVNEAYRLRVNYTLETFLSFYQHTGWAIVEKIENTLIISGLNQRLEDPQKVNFLDSFTLNFENQGYVVINL